MAIVRRGTTTFANQKQKDEIKDSLEDNLVPIISTVGNVAFNRPQFVARADDEGPFGNAVKALTRYNCRRWGSSDKSAFSPRVNMYNADVCGPYLSSIDEAPDSGAAGRQFPGGQCDAVAYSVKYTSVGNGQTGNQAERLAWGPVGGMRWVGTTVGVSGNFTGSELQIFCRGVWQAGESPPIVGVSTWRFVGSQTLNATTPVPSVTVNSVTRTGGGVDNCGSAPVLIRPPGVVVPVTPVPPTTVITLPGIGPVTVNVTFGPEGDTIVNLPDLDISIDTKPVSDPAGGGGAGGGRPPGDVGDPGTPSGTGPGGDTEGTAPAGQVLVGLRLDLAMAPPYPNVYAPGIYRGAAYIYMGTPAGLDQDYAGSMLVDGQFVFAEQPNLTKWRVRANSGYDWSVTPYYTEGEQV